MTPFQRASALPLRHTSLALLAAVLCAGPAFAIQLGQVDDFEGGAAGWGVGASHPLPPEDVPDGGPMGAGDAWLQLSTTGFTGPGGRLAVFNRAQWAGDYTSAGVTSLGLFVNGISGSSVALRLSLRRGGDVVASATPTVIAPQSGWQWVELSLDPADLAAVSFGADPATVLASVDELRLLHAQALPSVGGSTGSAIGEFLQPATVFGLDEITALPEPGVACLQAAAVATMLAGRRVGTRLRRRPVATNVDR